MTMVIQTLNGGEIETGFWGPDTSRIQLGELPPMTTQQFVGYAVLSLVEGVIPSLNAEKRAEWAQETARLRENIGALAIKNVTGKFFASSETEIAAAAAHEGSETELFETYASRVAPTDDAVYYKNNPFKIQANGQRVSFTEEGQTKHIIDAEDFFNLTFNVIHGGIMGWDKHGTYPEVKEAANRLNEALS